MRLQSFLRVSNNKVVDVHTRGVEVTNRRDEPRVDRFHEPDEFDQDPPEAISDDELQNSDSDEDFVPFDNTPRDRGVTRAAERQRGPRVDTEDAGRAKCGAGGWSQPTKHRGSPSKCEVTPPGKPCPSSARAEDAGEKVEGAWELLQRRVSLTPGSAAALAGEAQQERDEKPKEETNQLGSLSFKKRDRTRRVYGNNRNSSNHHHNDSNKDGNGNSSDVNKSRGGEQHPLRVKQETDNEGLPAGVRGWRRMAAELAAPANDVVSDEERRAEDARWRERGESANGPEIGKKRARRDDYDSSSRAGGQVCFEPTT